MIPQTIQHKRILISPMNWVMGHVARCIPLIDRLMKQGNTVIVAGDETQQEILKQYFPNLEMVLHTGYPFHFGVKGNFTFDLASRFMALNRRLKQEIKETEQLVEKFQINCVISDHRYGFRSTKVPSILLCHQVNLPVRSFEAWVQRIHHNFLRNFTTVWVPDYPDSRLSGELSKNKRGLNAEYIGSLSRFSRYSEKPAKDLDEVIIVSGPLVYGRAFLHGILNTEKSCFRAVICQPELIDLFSTEISKQAKIEFHTSRDWIACDHIILRAKKLVSRSGYSTLMDLHELGIPSELSATPGQREQEYLLGLWNK